MRQTIKIKKDGQEVTFVCSECGNNIHNMFIPIGETYEPDWNNISEICECGMRLVNRYPIIEGDIEIFCVDDIKGNKSSRRSIIRNVPERSETYNRRMKDLEIAISIDYFDMRLECLKRENFTTPDNIDCLRLNCIKRNISHIERILGSISTEKDEYGKRDILERLNNLKIEYNNLYKKLDDKSDSYLVGD